MKIQKIYIVYSIVMWILWGTIMILVRFSGNAYNVQNEQLFFALRDVSRVVNLISLIPVIPVMWMISFINSIETKKRGYIGFNIISIVLNCCLWFQYFATHIVSIMGGV